MAPKCVCGHRASDHKKQMKMRTRCLHQGCVCGLYTAKEK